MTQPKLDRERIKRVEELQIFTADSLTGEDFAYIQETNELIQELFVVTNGWNMGGHSRIDEVCVYKDSLYVRVVWVDGDNDTAVFPASILDSDDPVKAARVDYLKKQIANNTQAIAASNRRIATCNENIVKHQQELVKLTGSANG